MRNDDRHYRGTILPLGLFLVVGGLLFAIGGLVTSEHRIHVPAVESAILRRLVISVCGAIFVILGIGYLFRRRWAWIASVVLAGLGTIGRIALHSYAESRQPAPDYCSVLAAAVIGVSVVVGLYLVGRSAFSE